MHVYNEHVLLYRFLLPPICAGPCQATLIYLYIEHSMSGQEPNGLHMTQGFFIGVLESPCHIPPLQALH